MEPRRYSSFGSFQTPPSKPPAGNFSEMRRVVHSMVKRCCVIEACTDVSVRGLGRIAYVAGALENERPLYRILTLHPRLSVRRVPPYVAFILNRPSLQRERSRHYPCAVNQLSSDVSPRVDAQASDERTGIGDWYSWQDKNTLHDFILVINYQIKVHFVPIFLHYTIRLLHVVKERGRARGRGPPTH